MAGDLELLALEVETLWEISRGRLVRRRGGGAGPHLVVAVSGDGARRVWFGDRVRDPVARRILSLMSESIAVPPDVRPPHLTAGCTLLSEDLGPVATATGPSYTVPSAIGFHPTAPLALSGGTPPAEARSPAPGWRRDEWDDLLAGRLGPWAMSVAGGRVVSLCHCSRLTATAAEAGVWTAPDHRGQGLAASVTAAWAGLLARDGRRAFYSTSKENRSSQRVATRLGLRHIGWIWQVSPRPANDLRSTNTRT